MAGFDFNTVPSGTPNRGYDFVFDDGGTMKLAERLGARGQQNRISQQNMKLKEAGLRQRADLADLGAFGKAGGLDAGDYHDLIDPQYNDYMDQQRQLYKQGQFNRADFTAGLIPLQNEYKRLKNLSELKKTRATGLNTDGYLDPGTYGLGFDEQVKKSYKFGQPIDTESIHQAVMQNGDVVYGSKIADDVIKGIQAVDREISVPYIDPVTGQPGQTTKTTKVPTIATLDPSGKRITGYDTESLVQNYMAHPKGQARFQKLLASAQADPNSTYSKHQKDFDNYLATGKINQAEHERLSRKNQYNAIAKDFGDLDSKFGFTFKSGVNLESQTQEDKDRINSMGLRPGETILRSEAPRGAKYGGQKYTLPTENYTLTNKELSEFGPVDTKFAWKEGTGGNLVRTTGKDNFNEGLANQAVGVTVLPVLSGVSLVTPNGQVVNKVGSIIDFEGIKKATDAQGRIHYQGKDGQMYAVPKDAFMNSSAIQFPLHAKVQVSGREIDIPTGPSPEIPPIGWEKKGTDTEEYKKGKDLSDKYWAYQDAISKTNKKQNKGTYFLPLSKDENPYLLNKALEKGRVDEATLRQRLKQEALNKLIKQKEGSGSTLFPDSK